MSYRDYTLPDPETQPEFYADVPTKRLVAFAIDTVVSILIALLILPFTAFIGIFFFAFLVSASGFIYRVVTLATGSATWGMRLVSLEMRDRAGQRFDLATAFLHTVGFYISCAVFPLQLISVILMLTTARAQGLSDHLLGSVAINRSARF
ncbi:MAG: RDD family protein [Rhodobacteraceae bacterium]|nr:RDD family protein [Paracoccaceae bacterium]